MLIHIDQFQGVLKKPGRIVIIGSGAVGLHLAVGLAKEGRQVIVLESGRRNLGGFNADSFEVVGRDHGGIKISRSRTLGGTTNLWGGQLVEFMPQDFARRDWQGGEKWPIEFAEIASYYPKTYESLGIPQDMHRDADIWRTLGIVPPELGNGLEVFLTRWMRVPNLAVLYDEALLTDPNLLVITGCTATDFSYDGSNLTEVTACDEAGRKIKIDGETFVLAAGTIENSRLMLNAALTPECPWVDNPMLGRRFQDHLGGRIADLIPQKGGSFQKIFSTAVLKGEKFQPKVRVTDSTVQQAGKLNMQAMIAFEGSVTENLVFLKQFVKAALHSRRIGSFGDLIKNMFACSKHFIPLMWKFTVEHRILIPTGSKVSLHIQTEGIPTDASRIMIDPTQRDVYGLPKVILDWRIVGDELSQIKDFAENVKRSLTACGMAETKIDPELENENPKFLDQLYDTGHQVGGCMMVDSSQTGVVDKDLRVFGTDNFYILGACVFRTAGNANTTFTAMALGTRLKEHLSNLKSV